MLLPLQQGLPASAVFTMLNREILSFVVAAADAVTFGKELFSEELRRPIWDNEPTREKFLSLWIAMRQLGREARAQLVLSMHANQDIAQFFGNTMRDLPAIHDTVMPSLSDLGKHLFSRTCKLADIEAACDETVQDHFNTFQSRPPHGNGNVCCICGTDVLAQYRANVDLDDQWRGPYDHLLAKEKYALYIVHPINLLPICYTCNSKAKLAKDLLRNGDGQRRLCFDPRTESAHEFVSLSVTIGELVPIARVVLHSNDANSQQKLETWDDVYRIRDRVEGEFSCFIEKLDQDCVAVDYEQFRANLEPQANAYLRNCRLSAWNFWKGKLYDWLTTQDDDVIDLLWVAIQQKRNDPDARYTYGI